MVLGTYTWSKDMGTADTQTGFQEAVQPGEVQNWNNLQAEYGPLSYNVPRRFVAAYVYDLPIGKGKHFLGNQGGVVDKVVGGWGVDGITTYALGFPLIFTAQPTFLSQQFGAGQPRPNVVPGCQKKLSGSAVSRQHGWFNTNCFTAPSNYGFGDERRTDSHIAHARNSQLGCCSFQKHGDYRAGQSAISCRSFQHVEPGSVRPAQRSLLQQPH